MNDSRHRTLTSCTAAVVSLLCSPAATSAAGFVEARAGLGLDGIHAARLLGADLNGDDRPDLVVRPTAAEPVEPLVFLCSPDPAAPFGVRFHRVESPRLPKLTARDVLTLADLDNDGWTDAIIARYIDYLQEDFAPGDEPPVRTARCRGRGDGTFGEPRIFREALAATTAAVAVGDVNLDGLPDVWLGNWYEKYFSGYEAFSNDLLLQYRGTENTPRFARWPMPRENTPTDRHTDSAGRPTYGAMIIRPDPAQLPMLWEINYGRRWDRLWRLDHPQPIAPNASIASGPGTSGRPARPKELPGFAREEVLRALIGEDIAPAVGVDGDAIRHGQHPPWLAERAKEDPRFARADEPPFRANGNGFDGAIADIDNDGDLDLFVSTIIHAWAGDSSDRSRFLVNRLQETGRLHFDSPPELSVDRLPPPPAGGEPLEDVHKNQNQGDIFCELADLNNDGRLDLVLCSSDYSDPPPYDERLRVFLQQTDGTFEDSTAQLGIDHIGAGQPVLADINADGALDLIVGQTFNRLNAGRREAAGKANGTLAAGGAAEPRLHVYINQQAGDRGSIALRLKADPGSGVTSDAFGAIATLTADLDGDPTTPAEQQMRHLTGPGGHAGKRHEAILHFGLRDASFAERVRITWPSKEGKTTELEHLQPGEWTIHLRSDGQVSTALKDR